MNSIRVKLKKMINGIVGSTIFLFLLLCSLTNLEIAIGSPNDDKVINKLKVGSISEYIEIPSKEIVLVNIIFMIIPNIFDKNPPNINIITDFIKLFFIIKYMR